jgi:hypothetical protein
MGSDGDLVNGAKAMCASPEVTAFMGARRTPRARATRKIESVSRRLIAAQPPLDRARSLWVCGSYARGAPNVGDVDLLLDIDEPREPGQQAIEAFYRRAHPYAEVVKALGCGGGSIVTLEVTPVFQPALLPISPERAQGGVPAGHEIPRQPFLRHLITGDPFDPQPTLLWVRGDHIDDVRTRLGAISGDPNARRFERTTTVPLIDTLLPLLGVPTGFQLAAQIRAGNIDVDALLLTETPPPPEAEAALLWRYQPGSERSLAAAAALSYLQRDGVELDRVQLGDGPVTDPAREPQVELSFNAFLLYLLDSRVCDDGWRHLHVWPSRRGGRWLALDATVKHGRAARKLAMRLNGDREDRNSRYEAIREALGMPPLQVQT